MKQPRYNRTRLHENKPELEYHWLIAHYSRNLANSVIVIVKFDCNVFRDSLNDIHNINIGDKRYFMVIWSCLFADVH